MLGTEDRSLLVDLITPPVDGYRLDHALATTFTLDLMSLVQVPLAFTGADLDTNPDPLGVLQALRSNTDRLDVFCQVGQIAVPAKRNDLLAFLERTVHQVRRPRSGALFHPKLWVLRFTRGDDDPERFRLICGSRNLTGDRAWDVALTLDGEHHGGNHRRNKPLVEFIASLPDRVVPGMPRARRTRVRELAESLRRVEWDRPDGASDDWLAFHVFGPGRSPQVNLAGYRHLIISPFLNDAGLEKTLTKATGPITIVSRPESFDALSDEWKQAIANEQIETKVLNDALAVPDLEDEEAGLRWELSGLHAKLYIVERNRQARVFIGSANATGAAWSGNDEILVEITGRPKFWGVDALLADSKQSFDRLLDGYEPGELVADPDTELIFQLQNCLRDLVERPITGHVVKDAAGTWSERLTTTARLSVSVPGATLDVALSTDPADRRPCGDGSVLDELFVLAELESITPFAVFRLAVGDVVVSTVALVHLEGDPPERLDCILTRQFSDRGAFLRFLLLLLQLAGRDDSDLSVLGTANAGPWRAFGSDGSGLLEALVDALARDPAAIDDVGQIIDRIRNSPRAADLIPDEWDDVWAAVVKARSTVGPSR